MFIDIFKHLLPNARAWRLTVEKQLRQFFEGLAEGTIGDSKEFLDSVFNDLDPQLTRQLPEGALQSG
mgnify:CR=1 FL=1